MANEDKLTSKFWEPRDQEKKLKVTTRTTPAVRKKPMSTNLFKKITEEETREDKNKQKMTPTQERRILTNLIKEQNKDTDNVISHMTNAIVDKLQQILNTNQQ